MHYSAASRTPPPGQPDRDEMQALRLLTEGMTGNWTLEGLTTLLFGIPKLQRGLPHTAALILLGKPDRSCLSVLTAVFARGF